MECDESPHALSTPYDACPGVFSTDKASEGVEVVEPVLPVVNVSLARGGRVIALPAQVGSINRGPGVVLLQVLAENTQVGGRTRDPMEPHHHQRGWTPVAGEPLAVGEPVTIERGKGRLFEGRLGNGAGRRSVRRSPCRRAGSATGEHKAGQCHHG